MQAQPTAPLYPEHEKLRAVSDRSQAIGEFLDMGGYTLSERRDAGNNGEWQYVWKRGDRDREPNRIDYLEGRAKLNPLYKEWEAGWVPVMKPISKILAEWFGIDMVAIDREKAEMLESLRAR